MSCLSDNHRKILIFGALEHQFWRFLSLFGLELREGFFFILENANTNWIAGTAHTSAAHINTWFHVNYD